MNAGWLYQDLPLFAYARSCDPATSRESAAATKLVVTGLRLVFVHQVREHGPCTANEAVESFENNHYAQSEQVDQHKFTR